MSFSSRWAARPSTSSRDLDGLRAAVGDAGFDIAFESVANRNDWAHYEETLAANAERHCAPDTLAYARRIRDRRLLPGGTDNLGVALLVFRTRAGTDSESLSLSISPRRPFEPGSVSRDGPDATNGSSASASTYTQSR